MGWEQEPLLEELDKLDVDIYGIHYNDEYNKEFKYKKVLICDFLDLKTILKFSEVTKPDAVISDQDDYAYYVQALIAEKFNLPGPRTSEAVYSVDKYLQRQKCRDSNIKVPAFNKVSNVCEVIDFSDKFKFPIIIKPVDSRGSFGVNKVLNKSQIKSAFNEALENSPSKKVIVEKFIEGVEITVDGYCFDKEPISLALALKGKINSKTQVSVDIKYPGELSSQVYEKAMRNNEKVAIALGYNFGMIHSEYIVTTENEIYLVESANRGGGCYTSEIIVPSVSGIDILSEYINNVLGFKMQKKSIPVQKNEVILKFFTFKEGKINSIDGLEMLKKDKSILKYRIMVNSGDEIKPVSNDANRHGFVIVRSDTKVRSRADSIIKKINVKYD